MNQRAKLFFIASFAAFAASVYALAAAAAYRPTVVPPAPTAAAAVSPADTSAPAAHPTAEAHEEYRTKIIRLYRGRVAVFEEGSETPVRLLPTDVDGLPANAVERLKEGVYAYTAEQYQNYVEDFS